ncbi:MAG: hypothetical protein ABIH21_04230 [Patescibacteria group bacterium]
MQIQKAQALKLTEQFLKNFDRFWSLTNLPPEEKRRWIQLTIKRIWVKDKKVVAIEPHDDFKPLFSAYKKVIGQSPLAAPRKNLP